MVVVVFIVIVCDIQNFNVTFVLRLKYIISTFLY